MAAAVLVLASGCRSTLDAPGGLAGADGVRESSEQVREEVRVLAEVLDGDGRVISASGATNVCSSAPAEGINYAATGKLDGDGEALDERLSWVRAAYEQEGWEVSDEGVYDGAAWVNFVKDDLTGSLREDALQASEALTFSVKGPCIPTSDDETDQLLGPSEPLLP